jgi:RimJ/RimL family protein N-acetyltransferase
MDLRLREVEPGDLPLFFVHQQDPGAAALAAFPSRDHAAFDAHWAKTLADPANLVRTVVVDDVVAGNVCSFMRDGLREVGYWIDRAFWGRGVATAALAAYLRLEQTRPLHAGVATHNAPSLRVLQKCGFTFLRGADGEPLEDDSHFLLVLMASGLGDRSQVQLGDERQQRFGGCAPRHCGNSPRYLYSSQ